VVRLWSATRWRWRYASARQAVADADAETKAVDNTVNRSGPYAETDAETNTDADGDARADTNADGLSKRFNQASAVAVNSPYAVFRGAAARSG
jgi:hypothetical protein